MVPKPEDDQQQPVLSESDGRIQEEDEEQNVMTNDVTEEEECDPKKNPNCRREVPLVELALQNVTYAPVTASANAKGGAEKKRKVILQNISTTIAPYRLHAWIGPSGSGKTSLISVAADLCRPGDLTDDGVITVNGEQGKIPKRLVGVVWQDDLLMSNLTVQENIFFAARLKTPESTPDSAVRKVVEETMEELGLSHVRDSLVGSPLGPRRGVSGGERKRVSVAVELVVRPSLLLLDEPTSGLDATTAQSLIGTLKELAEMGHSIAVVIHQPRTTIFNAFDHLLLLSKGRILYDGQPSMVRTYLEQCPSVLPLPPETGIADWIMDTIIDDEHRKDGSVLPQSWVDCPHKEKYIKEAVDLLPLSRGKASLGARRMSSLQELNAVPTYNTTFTTQLKLLTQRTLKQQRGERITAVAIILQLFYLFCTALFWWRMPNNSAYIFTRKSLYFFMVIAQANGIVINAVTVFQRERTLLSRERAKKMYRVSPYFLAKTVSDMSTNVLLPVIYGMVVYWTANFRHSFTAYLKFFLAYYMILSCAQSMGLYMSIVIRNVQFGLVMAPPITLLFIILAGFYIPLDNLNPGIRWATWLSFARYGYSALLINEFEGSEIPCASSDASFSIGVPGECPISGDDVIAEFGLHDVTKNYWFNVAMVLVLQILFRFAAYVQLRRSK